jgi:hypothetical protein
MYISLTIFLFRSGIAFYFHLFSTVQVTVRPKKKYVCLWSHVKKIYGRSALIFLLSAKPEIVVSGSGISFSKFPVSRHLLKLFYDENTEFFYLLCSQFQQKASSWINKKLLLIKRHITYMNISRYANIVKFVNIQYIFLLARRAYSWLFQLAQMWKLLAPGIGLGYFLTPAVLPWIIVIKIPIIISHSTPFYYYHLTHCTKIKFVKMSPICSQIIQNSIMKFKITYYNTFFSNPLFAQNCAVALLQSITS